MAEEKKVKTLKVEPELTLESIDQRITEMVGVLNNLIQYCNTVERWRTMQFKKAEDSKDSKEPQEVISKEDDKK